MREVNAYIGAAAGVPTVFAVRVNTEPGSLLRGTFPDTIPMRAAKSRRIEEEDMSRPPSSLFRSVPSRLTES